MRVWGGRRRGLMRMLITVACVLAASVLLGSGIAQADSADEQYLAALSAQGITGDPGQLIAEGRAACNNYGGPALVGQMTALMGRGMTSVQASNLVLVGMRAYCPEKIPAGMPLG